MKLKEFILLSEEFDIEKDVLFNPTKRQLLNIKKIYDRTLHFIFNLKFFAVPKKREIYVSDGHYFIHDDLAKKAGYHTWNNKKHIIGHILYDKKNNKFKLEILGDPKKEKERKKALESFIDF